jgi:hypothetical protein
MSSRWFDDTCGGKYSQSGTLLLGRTSLVNALPYEYEYSPGVCAATQSTRCIMARIPRIRDIMEIRSFEILRLPAAYEAQHTLVRKVSRKSYSRTTSHISWKIIVTSMDHCTEWRQPKTRGRLLISDTESYRKDIRSMLASSTQRGKVH